MNSNQINNRTASEIDPVDYFGEELADWIALTPEERWLESEKLWEHYLSLGGSLDPEPDTQSPFYDPDQPSTVLVDGRPSMHIVRRSGV